MSLLEVNQAIFAWSFRQLDEEQGTKLNVNSKIRLKCSVPSFLDTWEMLIFKVFCCSKVLRSCVF